jgi:hypothetical protein
MVSFYLGWEGSVVWWLLLSPMVHSEIAPAMAFNTCDTHNDMLVRYFVSQVTDTPASHPSPRSRDYDRAYNSCCLRVQ